MTKHYTEIQEKVIDGITKYYYYDEAQLVVGYFDSEEEAIADREEYSKYLLQLIESERHLQLPMLDSNETSTL